MCSATVSHYLSEGKLTPEEFVAAGDQLTTACQTWTWQRGDDRYRRDFLPAEKQFLLTRNVPCQRRVRSLVYQAPEQQDSLDNSTEDSWTVTHVGAENNASNVPIPMDVDMTPSHSSSASSSFVSPFSSAAASSSTSMMMGNPFSNPTSLADAQEMIPDMEEFDDPNNVVRDPNQLNTSIGMMMDPNFPSYLGTGESNIMASRRYDVAVTYDKLYQSPRVYLFGYDEAGRPLTAAQIWEDISDEHANKTVTWEPMPHLGVACASIHPCKHASLMKKLIDRLRASGRQPDVNQVSTLHSLSSPSPSTHSLFILLLFLQSLFMFLKFVQTAIPFIEYDIAGHIAM